MPEGAEIKWQPSDVEGAEIRLHGPVGAIYNSAIFEDPDALVALASEYNLNDDIQMNECEMQA